MADGAGIIAAAEREKARVYEAGAEVALAGGRADALAMDVLAGFARVFDALAGAPVLAGRGFVHSPIGPGRDVSFCADEGGRGVLASWGPSDGNPRDGFFRALDVRTVGLGETVLHTSFGAAAGPFESARVGYGTWLWIEVRSSAGLGAMMAAWSELARAFERTGHTDETIEQRGQQWIDVARRQGLETDAKALAARAGAALAERVRARDDGTLTALELARRPYVNLARTLMALRRPERIERLDVSGDGLTSLPLEVEMLSGLRTLTAADNSLDAWPAVLERLPRLQHLDLSRNPLGRVPGAIVSLTQLRSLTLARARLTEVAGEIAALSELRTLSLADNQLDALPDGIFGLRALQWLDLRGNPLPAERVAAVQAKLQGCKVQSGERRRR